jgi:isopenicillin N synthase-like dioxygenase
MSATNVQSIPTVDLSSFAPGGETEERAKASQNLYNACHTLGFAYITGHGISPALLQDAFRWSKKLFDLPHDEKMKAPHPEGAIPHRGYSAPGIEKVYSKDDLERDEASAGQGASLRKIEDLKV